MTKKFTLSHKNIFSGGVRNILFTLISIVLAGVTVYLKDNFSNEAFYPILIGTVIPAFMGYVKKEAISRKG
jgi:hypothetical protein